MPSDPRAKVNVSKFDKIIKGIPKNIDPHHKELHRVRTADLERYKAGLTAKVTALCGKTWAPTVPMQSKQRQLVRCRGCFNDEKFSLAN